MTRSRLIDSFGGAPTPGLHSAEDAYALAKRCLPRFVLDHIDGGMGREVAPTENVQAFDRIKLLSRALSGTGRLTRSTVVFGEIHNAPIGIAPLGLSGLIAPGADDAMAQVASRACIPVCVSSNASTSLEEMMDRSEGRAWFQLYAQPTEAETDALVTRARNAGYRVLIVSVDGPQSSRRIRDLRNGVAPSSGLGLKHMAQAAVRPRWALRRLKAGPPRAVNLAHGADVNGRAGISWEYLARLKDIWPGRVVVRGITDPADVRRLKQLGVDGFYVSNGGGLQLDGSEPAIQSLWDLRSAAGSTMEILFDSGVRSGEDVLKAIAMGANMVMLGRPVLHAIAADGVRGLATYLDCVNEELEHSMAQIGASAVAEIHPRCLAAPPLPRHNEAALRVVNGPDAG